MFCAALLLGCNADPLGVPAVEVDLGTVCPVVQTPAVSLPDNEDVCAIVGGCCTVNLDCEPMSTNWFCVGGRCCMPLSAWRRERADAGR